MPEGFNSSKLTNPSFLRILLSSPVGLLIVALLLAQSVTAVTPARGEEALSSLEPRVSARDLNSALATQDLDALTLDSDFTQFMRDDCPDDLRLRALRRLWTLIPGNTVVEDSAI